MLLLLQEQLLLLQKQLLLLQKQLLLLLTVSLLLLRLCAGNADSQMSIKDVSDGPCRHGPRSKVGRELKYDIGQWIIIIICCQLLQS